eukprot:6058562-Prymnesium_polylepis.1
MRGVQGETCPASRCETCPGPLPCRGRARWARACVRNCAWITFLSPHFWCESAFTALTPSAPPPAGDNKTSASASAAPRSV